MRTHLQINKPGSDGFLLNKDGSWNILCKTKSTSILASFGRGVVDCKRCLKIMKKVNEK